jgi:hypothetical protein
MADDTKQKPAEKQPKKPWYEKLKDAVGNAIGEAKFGGR